MSILVRDHLGNEFSGLRSMCKHWGISYETFRKRTVSGKTLAEALDSPANHCTNIGCKDHLGNRFNSLSDMCNYWGIKCQTYKYRIAHGYSKEEALTKSSNSCKECTDHLGNKFESITEMCKHWGITCSKFSYRLHTGCTVEEALTTGKELSVVDHLGNRYKTFLEMCKHWGVNASAVYSRINTGWSLEEALLTSTYDTKIPCSDHLGNNFSSIASMCKHWGVDKCTFIGRMSRKWSLEQALATPCTPKVSCTDTIGSDFKSTFCMCKVYNTHSTTLKLREKRGVERIVALVSKDPVHLFHIGLDGKAYYQFDWAPTPQTARQVVEHYRPDLLDLYDQYNPTGKWNPYIVGVADNSGKSN